MKDVSTLFQNSSQNVQIFGNVYRRHKCSKSWSSMEDPVVPLEKQSVRSCFGRTIVGKAIWKSSIGTRLGKSSKLGMFILSTRERGLFLSVCVDDINLADKKENISQTWKFSWKTLIWENQHHSSTMFIWVALRESVKLVTILWQSTEICSNRGFLRESKKKLPTRASGKPDAETISSWS